MMIPDDIATGISMEDGYFDLKGLSAYSSLGISTLRFHIKENGLPVYTLRTERGRTGKILVRRSEFDIWMSNRWKMKNVDVEAVADEIIENLRH